MNETELREIKSHIWNGWSSNLRGNIDDRGYIIHMWEEGGSGRGLCGSPIYEGGGVNLNEVEPGCIRCRRILRKRGLLTYDNHYDNNY